MKRIILFITSGIIVGLLSSLLAIYMWIGNTIQQNIDIAQQRYPGTPEEALILFLQDEGNTTKDRTHVAIWTLGKIQSKKALPLLRGYYKDDPEGKTCKDRHDTVLCQYEIYKAIKAIESGNFFTYKHQAYSGSKVKVDKITIPPN